MSEKKPTILFYPMPLWGHVMPMRGMMKEFVRRGHRVIVYATDEFRDVIGETGAYYVSYNEYWGNQLSTEVSLKDIFLDQLSARISVEDHFRENIARYSPIIAVFDQAFIWGKQTAKKYRIPFVVSAPTLPFNQKTLSVFWEDLSKHLDSYSLPVQKKLMELRNGNADEHYLDSLLTLDNETDCVTYFTKSFLPHPETYPMEHIFFAGNKGEMTESEENDKLLPGIPEKKTRPFVFVTMGTTGSYNPFFWMNCIRAFAGKDVDVVMVIWKYIDKELFADLPDNVKLIIEGDQREYLKHADLMVCHGGLNTITDGVWAGVPMVFYPLVADQFNNCRIAEDLHVGIALDNYKAKSISDAVDKVLSDESYRKGAAAIGDEMRKSGTTEELCDWILKRHAPGKSVYPKPLSFQQSDMLSKYERYATARALMNVGFVMDFEPDGGSRGIYALMKAVETFVKNNDGSRIRIIGKEDSPGKFSQQFRGRGYIPDVKLFHFDRRDSRYKSFLMKCWTEAFDISECVLHFRIAVFENGEFSLIAVFDHINTDQYALSLAYDSIKKMYTAILNEEDFSGNTPSFADYVDRQLDYLLSKRHRKDVDFWRDYLKGLYGIPSAVEKTLSDDFTIYRMNRVAKMALLEETAKLFSVSLDTFVFALYAVLCGKYLKQRDLFILRRYLNRINKEDMELFANCRAELPVHAALSSEKSFKELCMEIQKDSIIVQRHGRIPVLELEKLMSECAGDERKMPVIPVFGVGQEGFNDITKAFTDPEATDGRETVMSIPGIENKDLDIQLDLNLNGTVSLTLRGRTGRLEKCSGFAAFADELFEICERLNRDGDLELEQLMESTCD